MLRPGWRFVAVLVVFGAVVSLTYSEEVLGAPASTVDPVDG